MRSQLLHPSGSAFWKSRGAAMVAILAIHGLVAAFVVLAKDPAAQTPRAEPMMVTLTKERRPQSVYVPKVPLQDVRLPTPVMPMASFGSSEEPTTVIAVAREVEAPPAPAGEAAAPIMATTVEYVRRPVVVYPPAAKRARATGTVQVRALVEIDGHVIDVRVHHSSGHEQLDRAACDAVRGALFKPYMLNGAARSALVVVPIYFNLTIRTASS